MNFDQNVANGKHDFRRKYAEFRPWILNNNENLASFEINKNLVIAK